MQLAWFLLLVSAHTRVLRFSGCQSPDWEPFLKDTFQESLNGWQTFVAYQNGEIAEHEKNLVESIVFDAERRVSWFLKSFHKVHGQFKVFGQQLFENISSISLAATTNASLVFDVRTQSDCFFGYVVALYVYVWHATTTSRMLLEKGKSFLEVANKLLVQNDFDLLNDAEMVAVSSWDLQVNLWLLGRGLAFQLETNNEQAFFQGPASSVPHVSEDGRFSFLRKVVYGPAPHPGSTYNVVVGGSDDSSHMVPVGIQSHDVLYVSGHFGQFYDAFFVLEKTFPSWKLHNHGVLSYHKEYFPQYQTNSAVLQNLLDSVHDHSEGQNVVAKRLHRDMPRLREAVEAWVRSVFGDKGPSVILCGHPVLWCDLFTGLPHSSIVAGYNQPYQYMVPEEAWEPWTARLRAMLNSPKITFVGYTPYHSLQLRWALSERRASIPYQGSIALRLHEACNAERANDDGSRVLRVHETPPLSSQQVFGGVLAKVLSELARTDDAYGNIFLWRKDSQFEKTYSLSEAAEANRLGMLCDRKQRMDLAIIWPYDVFHLKLAELYALEVPLFAHAELWRHTRRGSHSLQSGQPSNAAASYSEEAQTFWTSCIQEALVERVHVETRCAQFFSSIAIDKAMSLGNTTSRRYSRMYFDPFEWQGRFELDPWASVFYQKFSSFARYPHITYFRSMADLLSRLRSLSVEKLVTGESKVLKRTKMLMKDWYNARARETLIFWQRIFVGATMENTMS